MQHLYSIASRNFGGENSKIYQNELEIRDTQVKLHQ